MSYKAKGMHLAEHPEEGSAVVLKKPGTPRSILGKRRKSPFRRMLDSWDMVAPQKAIVMPGSKESPLTPRISRKKRVSPLTRIAEKLPMKLPVLTSFSIGPQVRP